MTLKKGQSMLLRVFIDEEDAFNPEQVYVYLAARGIKICVPIAELISPEPWATTKTYDWSFNKNKSKFSIDHVILGKSIAEMEAFGLIGPTKEHWHITPGSEKLEREEK